MRIDPNKPGLHELLRGRSDDRAMVWIARIGTSLLLPLNVVGLAYAMAAL